MCEGVCTQPWQIVGVGKLCWWNTAQKALGGGLWVSKKKPPGVATCFLAGHLQPNQWRGFAKFWESFREMEPCWLNIAKTVSGGQRDAKKKPTRVATFSSSFSTFECKTKNSFLRVKLSKFMNAVCLLLLFQCVSESLTTELSKTQSEGNPNLTANWENRPSDFFLEKTFLIPCFIM